MVRQLSGDQRLAQALLLYGERSDFHKFVLCPRSFVCLPLSHLLSLVSSIVFLASAFPLNQQKVSFIPGSHIFSGTR